MKSRIDDTRREMFYAELHALLSAGLDFSHAFALLSQGEGEESMRALVRRLYDDVVRGAALWQAMERSGVFRPLECGVVRIGDRTGRLPETLEFMREYYRKRIDRRRMVAAAVSYPAVILATAGAVTAFMLAVVVPMFEQVYGRMGSELPALTRRIIALAEAFPSWAAAATALFGPIFAILYANRKRKEVRRWIHECLLRLPLAGAIIRQNCRMQFCKMLGMLVSAGIPLLESVGMLAEAIDCYHYQESFGVIARELERGVSLARALARFPDLYDPKLSAVVAVAEETNRIPEMLSRQAEALDEQLRFRISRMANLIEPILILGVGILVAVILIAMYMPLFSIGGIVG